MEEISDEYDKGENMPTLKSATLDFALKGDLKHVQSFISYITDVSKELVPGLSQIIFKLFGKNVNQSGQSGLFSLFAEDQPLHDMFLCGLPKPVPQKIMANYPTIFREISLNSKWIDAKNASFNSFLRITEQTYDNMRGRASKMSVEDIIKMLVVENLGRKGLPDIKNIFFIDESLMSSSFYKTFVFMSFLSNILNNNLTDEYFNSHPENIFVRTLSDVRALFRSYKSFKIYDPNFNTNTLNSVENRPSMDTLALLYIIEGLYINSIGSTFFKTGMSPSAKENAARHMFVVNYYVYMHLQNITEFIFKVKKIFRDRELSYIENEITKDSPASLSLPYISKNDFDFQMWKFSFFSELMFVEKMKLLLHSDLNLIMNFLHFEDGYTMRYIPTRLASGNPGTYRGRPIAFIRIDKDPVSRDKLKRIKYAIVFTPYGDANTQEIFEPQKSVIGLTQYTLIMNTLKKTSSLDTEIFTYYNLTIETIVQLLNQKISKEDSGNSNRIMNISHPGYESFGGVQRKTVEQSEFQVSYTPPSSSSPPPPSGVKLEPKKQNTSVNKRLQQSSSSSRGKPIIKATKEDPNTYFKDF